MRADAMSEVAVVVLGAGGNSLAIVDAIEELNRRPETGAAYILLGFLDDIPENRDKKIMGYPVLGRIDQASRFSECVFINGIASESSYTKKPEIVARSGVPRERFVSIVHPRATVARTARIGNGTSIMANSVICPEAVVGDHVIILQNTVVNHHSVIADHVTLSSGITILGYIKVEDSAFIGGGASIRPYVKIGPRAMVGMGAVVVKDVPADGLVAGNPARPMMRKARA
jgi:sugar O-acyltransferase (sialic acid O-acetyltransferase NeuD family)